MRLHPIESSFHPVEDMRSIYTRYASWIARDNPSTERWAFARSWGAGFNDAAIWATGCPRSKARRTAEKFRRDVEAMARADFLTRVRRSEARQTRQGIFGPADLQIRLDHVTGALNGCEARLSAEGCDDPVMFALVDARRDHLARCDLFEHDELPLVVGNPGMPHSSAISCLSSFYDLLGRKKLGTNARVALPLIEGASRALIELAAYPEYRSQTALAA